jgi:hypothetical protein
VALGYTPSWLSGLSSVLQRVSAFLTFAQGFLGLAWVLSAMANPIMGAVKGAGKLIASSITLMFKGAKQYASLLTASQLDNMSSQQLHYQCLADAIQGCE